MIAKNKHILSSRDSDQGRSISVHECAPWLDMPSADRPSCPSRGSQCDPRLGKGGPQALCPQLRAEPVIMLCNDRNGRDTG